MNRAPLLGILAGYAVLAALVQIHCIDWLTSDGECYLRIAVYTAHGDFRHAIFGHWSPLGSWLTVPMVAAGMVPRVAFRVMIALWGAAAVAGVWRLSGRFGLRGGWRAAATACAALLAAEFSAQHRVDLLLAALLLCYLDAVMDPRVLASRLWAARVGALGGLAYLAKLYAFPFFALHFTLMVLAHAWAARGRKPVGSRQEAVGRKQGTEDRQREVGPVRPAECQLPPADRPIPPADCLLPTADCNPQSRVPGANGGSPVARAWLAGAAAFALVASPWVMTLSLRYGHLTLGTAAAQTYVQFGPGAADARFLAITGLRRPPADAYNVWQDAALDRPANPESTSPFRNRAAFAEQMRMVRRNVGDMLVHLVELDRLRLGLAAVALTPLALLVTWRRREAAFPHLAAAATLAVFCSGYAVIHAEQDRFFWFPMLLVVPVAFHFVALAAGAARRLARMKERDARRLAAALGLAAAASFAWRPAASLREILASPPPGREHRLIARQLAAWGVAGPLASAGTHDGRPLAWNDGLHVAYYLDAQYAGMPAAEAPDRIVVEMRDTGARTLLVWGEPGLAAGLRAQPGLSPVGVIPAESIPGLAADVTVFALRELKSLDRHPPGAYHDAGERAFAIRPMRWPAGRQEACDDRS